MMGPAPASLAITPLEAPPDASVPIPGSKSITNRALVCAALADGESTLTGALFADDTEAMAGALEALGASVECAPGSASMRVRGTGGRISAGRGAVIDARMSGTTGRFVAPVAALSHTAVVIDGDPQLRARPFADLVEALRQLEVRVEPVSDSEGLPLRVRGPIGANHVAVAADRSSQFLSGLMLAGPLVPGGLTLAIVGELVSHSYVEMTAAVMRSFGAVVEVGPNQVTVAGSGYRPVRSFAVEPDASAASYFWAAAAVSSGTVQVEGLGTPSVQGDTAFASLLAEMGASVSESPDGIGVTGSRLRGVDVDLSDMSDTAPTLGVVASLAETPTTVRGIGFVRGKESDRIAAVVAELRRCGVAASETDDGFVVEPGASPAGALVHTYDDHRIAMAFSVLGLVVPGVRIENPGCVAKTFPGFFEALDALRRPSGAVR